MGTLRRIRVFGRPMTFVRHMADTARLVLAGAALAAVLGTGAGAALRPDFEAREARAAPQQLILSGAQLASAEAAGLGWPQPGAAS